MQRVKKRAYRKEEGQYTPVRVCCRAVGSTEAAETAAPSFTMNLVTVLQTALGRMDYLLMLTFVQFIRGSIEHYFSTTSDILYISVAAALVTTAWSHTACSKNTASPHIRVQETMSVIVTALHRGSTLLLVDTLMKSLRTVSKDDTDQHEAFMYWISATGAVILIPVMVQSVQQTETSQQLARLIFFMYAENSEFLTQDSEINRVAPALAVVGLCFVHHFTNSCSTNVLFSNLLHAANMLLMNIILNTLIADGDEVAADSEAAITWVVTLLLLTDQLTGLSSDASDVRDYAIWKSAQLLAANVSAHGVDSLSMICCSFLAASLMQVLTSASKSVSGHRLHADAVVELGLLVAVNKILDVAKLSMLGIPHELLPVVLLSMLCVVHVALH